MKVIALKLDSFRGFEQLDLKFNPRVNVLIGANGAGKTSILDAISMNLNHGIARLTIPDQNSEAFYPEHYMRANDINFNSKFCSNEVSYKLNNDKLNYSLSKNLFEDGFSFSGKEFEKYFLNLQNKIDEKTNLPVVVYYKAQLSYDIKLKVEKKIISRFKQLNAYRNAATDKSFSFSNFTVWFKEQEDIENEVRLREDPNFKLRDLSLVRDAVSNFLNCLIPSDKEATYSELSVIRAKPLSSADFNFNIGTEGELFIKKSGRFIKLEQLSDGEKKIILMVADIASRIAQLNPTLEEPLINANGVVMIDEIEQHLHPAWQRKLIYALITTFPKIQWFFTTHSETIIVSILEQIEDKIIDYNDINFNFLYNGKNVEIRQPNEFGQIPGGLKDFYYDVLEKEVNPF